VPISARIEGEGREALVRFTGRGVVTTGDLLDTLEFVRRERVLARGLPQLLDLSGAEGITASAADVRRLAESFAKEMPEASESRLAIVASRPVLFGMSRMYQSLTADGQVPISVFETPEPALAWLREAQGPEPG